MSCRHLPYVPQGAPAHGTDPVLLVPLVDRNPQQFMDIYRAKPKDFQTATIHIHRAAAAASHLRVGVLPTK